MNFPSIDELRDGIARVHAQSGGALDVYIVTPNDAVRLLADVLLGSAHAARLLRGVTSTAIRVERLAGQREAALCMCCLRPVRRLDGGTKIGIVAAASDDATDALGFAICPQCSAKPDRPPDWRARRPSCSTVVTIAGVSRSTESVEFLMLLSSSPA